MTIINTLSHLFAISTLTPMKVVPLISMQATWLQILNFTCKCGAADLNNIWIWITQCDSISQRLRKKKKKKVENANHQPVRERSSSGPVKIYFGNKGLAAELNSLQKSPRTTEEEISLIYTTEANKHNMVRSTQRKQLLMKSWVYSSVY